MLVPSSPSLLERCLGEIVISLDITIHDPMFSCYMVPIKKVYRDLMKAISTIHHSCVEKVVRFLFVKYGFKYP